MIFQETDELQKKQSWYQKNQLTLTKEDEDDYHAFCSDALLRIHILKQRLDRFVTSNQFHYGSQFIGLVLIFCFINGKLLFFSYKENAPKMFLELEEKIEIDPRLKTLKQQM